MPSLHPFTFLMFFKSFNNGPSPQLDAQSIRGLLNLRTPVETASLSLLAGSTGVLRFSSHLAVVKVHSAEAVTLVIC